jgi:nucleotide-binding universal stress UspA family protein
MMVVCMPTTVAGGGRKCYDFCGRWGFDEAQVINPSYGGHGQEPGADIALHLARHGITVEAQHIEVRDISTGNALLSRLSDESIDLLVMGAYGHSRLREMVLGGVTREVFQQMTVPVLMSH